MLPEQARQVTFPLEPALPGDFTDRQIGFRQQRADALEPHAPDLVKNRASGDTFEMPFGETARRADLGDHIRHADRLVAGVAPDEFQGARDLRVADHRGVGGPPGDHARGHRREDAPGQAFAAHERVQVLGQQKSGLLAVGLDTGHGWKGGVADQIVVIDTQHRHLIRHGQVRAHAGVQHLAAASVHGRENRNRFRQRLQPRLQARLLNGPVPLFGFR